MAEGHVACGGAGRAKHSVNTPVTSARTRAHRVGQQKGEKGFAQSSPPSGLEQPWVHGFQLPQELGEELRAAPPRQDA